MHDTHLHDTYDMIETRLKDDAIPEAVRAWVSDHLHDIQTNLDLVLRGDEGYKDFLLAYVQREVERSRPGEFYDDLDAAPYATVREAPICTCSYRGCDLKAGRLPAVVRNATDIRRGIREFQQTHRGQPVVIVGWPGSDADRVTGAREAWSAKRGLVKHYCRVLRSHLHPQGSVPEDDPLADVLADVDRSVRLTPATARSEA